jgi:hypothetical protein
MSGKAQFSGISTVSKRARHTRGIKQDQVCTIFAHHCQTQSVILPFLLAATSLRSTAATGRHDCYLLREYRKQVFEVPKQSIKEFTTQQYQIARRPGDTPQSKHLPYKIPE